MPTRLLRYVLAQYLKAFALLLAALLGAYLVIDFADRAHVYTGANVVHDVALLYACKAVSLAYRLAPAAALLAGGICASGLRQRGEVTALGALSVGPGVLYGGVLAGALAVSGGLFALGELPVRAASPRTLLGWAGAESDLLMATRFLQWGDFTAFYGAHKWFRGADRIYLLRREDGQGFADVSIFHLTPDFHLASRLDAARMQPLPDGGWLLENGQARTFAAEGQSAFTRFASRTERFPEDPGAFRLRAGRPEQLSRAELADELGRRERLALPARGYRLALQQKLVYPLLGIPAALLAAALALRRRRRGHLTAALVEGVCVVGVLGVVMVVSRALADSGAVSAASAAWTPLALLCAASAMAVAMLD